MLVCLCDSLVVKSPLAPHINLPSGGRQILAGRLWRTGLLLGGAAAARTCHSPKAALCKRLGLAEPRARRCGPALARGFWPRFRAPVHDGRFPCNATLVGVRHVVLSDVEWCRVPSGSKFNVMRHRRPADASRHSDGDAPSVRPACPRLRRGPMPGGT